MKDLKMLYNRITDTVSMLEPELESFYKEQPMYVIIDFTTGEIPEKINSIEFGKLLQSKLKNIR